MGSEEQVDDLKDLLRGYKSMMSGMHEPPTSAVWYMNNDTSWELLYMAGKARYTPRRKGQIRKRRQNEK